MKALQILPIRRGEISSESLDKLDKLTEFIKNNLGAKIWEFPRDTESITNLSIGQLDLFTGRLDKSTGQLDNFNETLQLIEVIARHFAANQDPLAKYKTLEYAASHIILLPTSKTKELTGVKPTKHFHRGIFVFSKTKDKIGRETAWRVQMTPSGFRPTT
jgi:hypothetical protein